MLDPEQVKGKQHSDKKAARENYRPGTFTTLAGYVAIGNHSSLAFAQASIDPPAPEPMTVVLAALGLAGVFGLRRKA